jgi:predicted small lipoprotein YifL
MTVRCARLLFMAALLVASGCGKKGPMLYPDVLIAQPPQQVTIEQSGATLRLSFDLPTKDLAGRKLEDLEAVQIARRVYQNNDCVSCQDQFIDLLKIDLALPAPAQRMGNRIVWVDSDIRSGERYQYRLKMVQKGGVAGGVATSPMAKIQPLPPVPVVKAHAVFGGLIVVVLEGKPPLDTSLAGYRLYRADGKAPAQPLAVLAAGTSRYEDQAVQHGVVYRYGARMLVKREDGVVAESESSELVSISVVDDPK